MKLEYVVQNTLLLSVSIMKHVEAKHWLKIGEMLKSIIDKIYSIIYSDLMYVWVLNTILYL